MGRFLNPGNGGFQRIIKDAVYVDKTGIPEFLNQWLDTSARFVCNSRRTSSILPQAIGKAIIDLKNKDTYTN